MSGKLKSDRKNIDNTLSTIDSLMDTASDVKTRHPKKNNPGEANKRTDDQRESSAPRTKGRSPSARAPQQVKSAGKATSTRKNTANDQPGRAQTKINTTSPTKTTPTTSSPPDRDAKTAPDAQKSRSPVAKKRLKQQIKPGAPPQTTGGRPTKLPDSKDAPKPDSATNQTDFSLKQRDLPVLDEIITEEELISFAAGKALPKRVITETFTPKTTTDKIIELLSIHLSDYNISRLEFEYLHELIDELLDTNEKP